MENLTAAHAVYNTRYRGKASRRFEDACLTEASASASSPSIPVDCPSLEAYSKCFRRWVASFGLLADRATMRGAGFVIERTRRLEQLLVQHAKVAPLRPRQSNGAEPRAEDFGIPTPYEELLRRDVTAHKGLVAKHWLGADQDYGIVGLVALLAVGFYVYFRPEPNGPLAGQLVIAFFLLPPLAFLSLIVGVLLSSALPRPAPRPSVLVTAYTSRLEEYDGALKKWSEEQATREEERKRSELSYWMSLDGWTFELEAAGVFESLGYEATVTSGSNDGGVDIYLRKNGRTIIVQCKHHVTRCSPAVVRELYGTLLHEEADEAFLLATGGFTGGAYEFSKGKPVQLITLEDLLRMRREGLGEMQPEYEACAVGPLAVAAGATVVDLQQSSSDILNEEEEEEEEEEQLPSIVRSFRLPGGRFVLSASWAIPEFANGLRISPDGTRLVTGQLLGNQKIWNTDGSLVGELEGRDLEFVTDGSLLVTSSYTGSPGDRYRVWDLQGKEILRFGGYLAGYSAAKRCFISEEEMTVTLRDTTGSVVLELEGWQTIVSPSGRHIIALSKYLCPVVYRLKKEGYGVSRRTEIWATEGWPYYFALRDTAFITQSDKAAHLWNFKGERLASFRGKVQSMSPSGTFVTSLTDDGVAVYRLPGELLGFSSTAPRFSRGDSIMVTRSEGRVCLRDCSTFESLAELPDADYDRYTQSVCIDESSAIIRRGHELFVLSKDGSVTELLRLDPGDLHECAASDDGSVFAITTSRSVSVFHRIST